jgi:hypothetical protein
MKAITVPPPTIPPLPNPIQASTMDKHCVADEYALIQFTPNDANKEL